VRVRTTAIAMTLCSLARLAAADPGAGAVETVNHPGRFQAALQAQWLPYGTWGSGGRDVLTAYGMRGWIGYRLLPNLEVGVSTDYLGPVMADDVADRGTAREIDVIPGVVAHTEPFPRLDLAFTAGLGMSWIPLPHSLGGDTASGVVIDLGGQVAYPITSGLSAVASVGYQRGAQIAHVRATVPGDPGPLVNLAFDVSTSFARFGAGVAYRF
jgi:hypothetical protein